MNLLPLDSFRRIMSMHPYHFWGFANNIVPIEASCSDMTYKYAWQNHDAVGRQEVIEAIESAEGMLAAYLGFSVAPRYTEKTVPWPTYFDRSQRRIGMINAMGMRVGVNLPEGNIQAIGIERLTLIGDAPVVYSDPDGDGLDERFTATLATTVTEPSEIAVYNVAVDRLNNDPVGDEWRIRPITVTISGGNVVVSGPSWLLARPVLYEGFGHAPLNPSESTNFVTDLSIYRRTTYTEGETLEDSQSVLLWDTEPCHGIYCWCSDCSGVTYDPASSFSDPAAVGKSIGRVGIRDALNGEVIPAQAIKSATTGIWYDQWNCGSEPNRVLVRYLAGYPTEANSDIAQLFRPIVARLAAAELGRPLYGCKDHNQELYRWQFDVSRAAGAMQEQYSISAQDLNNPFGTRRGHVWAWKQVRNLRLLRGISI